MVSLLIQMLQQVLCVHHGHDCVEAEVCGNALLIEEGLVKSLSQSAQHLQCRRTHLRNRRWISHAGCLYDDVIELIPLLQQPTKDANQITAHRTADAAVICLCTAK